MKTTKIIVLFLAIAFFSAAVATGELVDALHKQNDLLREQNKIFAAGLRCKPPVSEEVWCGKPIE